MIDQIHPLIHPMNDTYMDYLSDESRLSGWAQGIAFPLSEQDVTALLNHASRAKMPVTISGGRTGLTGASVPRGGLILSLEKMNRILGAGYDPETKEWYIRLQPGVLLKDLNLFLNQKDCKIAKDIAQDEDRNPCCSILPLPSLFYPPDSTEDTAQIGGNVATNASGARTFGFGPTRDYVRRLRIALISGEILDITRGEFQADRSGWFSIPCGHRNLSFPIPGNLMPDTKNTAGYYSRPGMDLIDLFIGSEGTLGVFTEIELRLIPMPAHLLAAMFFLPSIPDAVRLVRMLRCECMDNECTEEIPMPQAMEYLDSHAFDLLREKRREDGPGSVIPSFPEPANAALYCEWLFNQEETSDRICGILEELLPRAHGSLDNSWASFDPLGMEKMRILRHAVPETVNSMIGIIKSEHPGITKLGTDFAVPDAHLDTVVNLYYDTLDASGLKFLLFGHIGNNHIHVNILPRSQEEYDKGKEIYELLAMQVIRLGGTVAAEHGIGKLKKRLLRLMLGANGMEQMKRIKLAFDPDNLLNQGNLFE